MPGNYVYTNSLITSMTYTAEGRVAEQTDRRGNTESFSWDGHGNLESRAIGTGTISYTYDSNGNVLTMTDGTGITARTYDAFNRCLSKTVPGFGTSTFIYDITDGLETGYSAERTIDDPVDNDTLRVYDRMGRLVRVITDGLTFTYTYNLNGSLQYLTYPGGAREDYTYNACGQVETITNRKADDTIIDAYTYTMDAAHNLVQKTDGKGITLYTYDATDRLLSVTEPSGKVTSYTYDGAGSRSTQTETLGTDITVTTYTYDALNRLTGSSETLNGTLTQILQYTYDNNGNQLQTILTAYTGGIPGTPVVTQQNTYDLRNQLIRTVTENGTIVDNVYNGDGLRVEKIVNGSSTRYLYEYLRVVLEQNSLGDVTGRNVYGTNLLMREVGVDAFFYMYNAHADVTALLSTSGAIIATYYYDAFGNILEQTGSASNSILFAGYQYDTETGMYYLNARMYDPVTARFMQEDTYTGQNNDPLSLNLYTYCHNEPLMYSDPTGHTPAGYETFTPPKKPDWLPESSYADYVAAAKKDWEFKILKALKPYMPDEAFEEGAAKVGYELVRPMEMETTQVIGEKKTITKPKAKSLPGPLRPDSDTDGIPNNEDDTPYGEAMPYIDDFDYDGVVNGLDATTRLANEEITYIFYEVGGDDWLKNEAMSRCKILEEQGKNVKVIGVSDIDDFSTEWGEMGEEKKLVDPKNWQFESTGKMKYKIEEVILVFHGNWNGICIDTDDQGTSHRLAVTSHGRPDDILVSSLEKKEIGTLVLSSCNGGNIDFIGINLASDFVLLHPEIDKVKAYDGSASYGVDGKAFLGFVYEHTWLTVEDQNYSLEENDIYRKSQGQLIYSLDSNNKVQVSNYRLQNIDDYRFGVY